MVGDRDAAARRARLLQTWQRPGTGAAGWRGARLQYRGSCAHAAHVALRLRAAQRRAARKSAGKTRAIGPRVWRLVVSKRKSQQVAALEELAVISRNVTLAAGRKVIARHQTLAPVKMKSNCL